MKGLYCRAGLSDAEPKFVIQEASLPDVIGTHQVRIQVKACGLSPLDLKVLESSQNVYVHDSAVYMTKQYDVMSYPRLPFPGILPLDSPFSGLCDVIDVDEHYLVQKPEKLSSVCAVGALRDGLCAYTALHTHARMAAGHTLLVMDGASPFGLMCIQLACYHGVKVLTTSHSPQKHTFLQQLRPSIARVIPVDNGSSDLLPVVMEETGGLGVDIVIDSGVRLQEEEESEEAKLLPHKHDIISVLGVGGHWVTSHQDLQLDPPDCRLLFLKSASVSFLNPEVWTASSAQQGRYLRILPNQIQSVCLAPICPSRPEPEEAVPRYEATVAMETVQLHQKKKAVVQL
uniref:Enoyl reductase (ER) domain-containing protein n=1 Tax=Monopterus albus TaxID=43700 RepID=A0A3Q3JS00_MONAL